MNALISILMFIVVLAGLGALIWVVNRLLNLVSWKNEARLHCMTCGTDAKARLVTRGNMGIELILWLCFLVPGLIYSAWRGSTRYKACSSCGAVNLVPLESPAAVAHRKTLGIPNIAS